MHTNLLTRDRSDIFEFVYFSRPDTIIDGIGVHQSRQNMGRKLAEKIRATIGDEAIRDIDVVIPIPETSNTAAQVVAEVLGKPLSMGLIKNRYVFRTFIMPTQGARQEGVRRKLSAMPSEFAGRCVLLVDDSIVRGSTSRQIVSMAKEAGAKKVIFASCAPRITHPHIYGIDLASPKELIAHNRTRFDIANYIGASEMIFQDLEDLKAACADLSPRDPKTQQFEVGLFCGDYCTAVPDGYLDHLDQVRGHTRKLHVEETKRTIVQAVANSEPVQVALSQSQGSGTSTGPHLSVNGSGTKVASPESPQPPRTPEDRQDIRYVALSPPYRIEASPD